MDLKRIFSATITYVALLIIAVAILLLTASMAYKQIKGLEKSADLVSHTLETDRSINNLFSHYLLMEAEMLRAISTRDTMYLSSWRALTLQNDVSFKNLRSLTYNNPKQQERLGKIGVLRDSLYQTFQALENRFKSTNADTEGSKPLILQVTRLLDSIKAIKNDMVLEEQALLLKRREIYQKDVLLTPRVSYLMALFSLGIFIFSFRKINRDKNKIAQTESFLQNILKSTTNIISHFEPIYSKKNEIVDFTILFTNDRIQDVTGAIPANIVGQPVSKVYPFLFENNVFEIWKECVEEKRSRSYETNYVFGGERMWFDSTVIPLKNGITVTARNNTNERVSQEKQAYLNNQLQIQNSILNQVKSIARVGSYRWYLRTDTIELSPNLYRLLGWEVNGFPPSLENYASFIHPEDLARFHKSISEIRNTRTSKDFSYRITAKDGSERHFYSRYQLYEKEGDMMMIVVIQDITKEIWNKLKLKRKNLELSRSNAELQSFNRVASHDLQEPLRKIQIFISRIYDSEMQQLSDKGREYFSKIDSAANRMQSLIRYLLTYSRVNDVQQDFEQIDLNGILEKVQEDQTVTIVETKTQLIYGNLPLVRGIRFQMEQLFNNIISNCIKYGPVNGHPLITITAEVLPKEKNEEGLLNTGRAFHKITIQDNGIGFDPEYSEKIFELFQRLHQKNEYSGTGIGLAICKKIVENHNGFIKATGKPDQGATFYIYLPL